MISLMSVESNEIFQTMTDECRGECFARQVFATKVRFVKATVQLFGHQSSLGKSSLDKSLIYENKLSGSSEENNLERY